jgi:hypothetical protein
MTELPEPLRLANWLEQAAGASSVYRDKAAAELRRMHRELQRLTQLQMQPCAGRNCGSTNPNLHSAECFEDYEKSTGMAQPEQGPMKHGGRPMTLRECMEAEEPAQPEQEQWDAIPDAFNEWWDADYDDIGNPYRKDSPAYWAWSGWKAASKQPAQEPVAWVSESENLLSWDKFYDHMTPLYTAPRQWQGLTNEERNNLWRDVIGWGDPSHDDEDLMKATESKLKEKNT